MSASDELWSFNIDLRKSLLINLLMDGKGIYRNLPVWQHRNMNSRICVVFTESLKCLSFIFDKLVCVLSIYSQSARVCLCKFSSWYSNYVSRTNVQNESILWYIWKSWKFYCAQVDMFDKYCVKSTLGLFVVPF